MSAHLLKRSHSAVLVWLMMAAAGWTQDARPKFEVTSVKVHAAGTRPGMNTSPGGLFMGDITLRQAAALAYRLPPFEVVGGPAWLDNERFDLTGRFATTEQPAAMSPEQRIRLMDALQGLLEDRFQLKVRRETQDTSVYNLTVGKSGPKLKEASDPPVQQPSSGASGDLNRIARAKATMADLANTLSLRLETHVADKTGLTGWYAFVVEWHQDNEGVSASTIAAALREQLGLNLERGKGPVEILAIESAQKPAEN